eukprot:GHVN01033791.1.p1 GENE.GHVN01033791.1~~GHVN01033791.1.p1  ORF type:complete len:134 (+),score=7.23 GHVN01033791.1:75-476(+)
MNPTNATIDCHICVRHCECICHLLYCSLHASPASILAPSIGQISTINFPSHSHCLLCYLAMMIHVTLLKSSQSDKLEGRMDGERRVDGEGRVEGGGGGENEDFEGRLFETTTFSHMFTYVLRRLGTVPWTLDS